MSISQGATPTTRTNAIRAQQCIDDSVARLESENSQLRAAIAAVREVHEPIDAAM